MNDLFNLPASDPPLEAQIRIARMNLATAEHELAEAVADDDDDGVRDLRAECCQRSRYLSRLEAELLRRMKQ